MSTKTLLSILFVMAILLSACGGEDEEPAVRQVENAASSASNVSEPEDALATEVVVTAESTTVAAFEEAADVAMEATEAAVEDENTDEFRLRIHQESLASFQETYGDFELSDRCFAEGEDALQVLDPADGTEVVEESPFPSGIDTVRFDYFSETGDQFGIYVGGRYLDEAHEGEPLAICIEATPLDVDIEAIEDEGFETLYPTRAELRSALNQSLGIEGDPAYEALWVIEDEGISLDELTERVSSEFPDVVDAFGPDVLRYGVGDVLLEMMLVDFGWLTNVDADEIRYFEDIDEFDSETADVRERWRDMGLDEEVFSEEALQQWLQYQPLYFAIDAVVVGGREEGFAFVSAVIDPRITHSNQVDIYKFGHRRGRATMNFLRINTDVSSDYVEGSIYPENTENHVCANDTISSSYSGKLYEPVSLGVDKASCRLVSVSNGSVAGYFKGKVTASGPATYEINYDWTAVVEGDN